MTDIITQFDLLSKYVVIVDENDEVIRKIKSYNNKTKEAELYIIAEDGSAKIEPDPLSECGGVRLVTEKKVLAGSRIAFKN